MSFYKEKHLKRKYAEVPEETKYKKKKKKKRVEKSNHKHHYVPCLYDLGDIFLRNGEERPMLWGGTYCDICGKVGDITFKNSHITQKVPIFEIDLLVDKFVPIAQ